MVLELLKDSCAGYEEHIRAFEHDGQTPEESETFLDVAKILSNLDYNNMTEDSLKTYRDWLRQFVMALNKKYGY